jgi:hypothetical protein
VQGLQNAALHFVDTEEGLRQMVAQLEGVPELAVDLEHHSFRSFLGITCLMQLSDRNSDFVVDVVKLRPHIGPLLAPIFADPQVPPPRSGNLPCTPHLTSEKLLDWSCQRQVWQRIIWIPSMRLLVRETRWPIVWPCKCRKFCLSQHFGARQWAI